MAHHHPSSPSGSSCSSHRRRLSELLGEQQEPFYLDLYLLEKGCSPAFLDAAACGGGGTCSTCWPRSRSTGGRLLLGRTPARCKKRRGVLRLLLSRILSGATTTAPVATKTTTKKKRRRQQQQQPAAIGWRHADANDEKPGPPPGRSKEDAGPSTTPRAVEIERQQQRAEVDDDEEREEEDDDGEDESSKKQQLSPVSVLEQRLFEHSPPPPPPHAQKAFVLFSELVLEASCTPSTLLSLLANAKQLRNSSKHGRRSADGGGSTPAPPSPRRFRRKKKNNSSHAARREDTLMMPFESDLAAATALVASELGGARVRPSDVGPEREGVAGDVAAAVLDALTQEAAAELMTTTMGMEEQPWLYMCGG